MHPTPRSPFQPGQTVMFLGDHTSPDDPGYVEVISGVLARFHPVLRLNLISAGASGQTAAALNSPTLLDILTSSRPDWLVLGIGLADALREPVAGKLLRDYQTQSEQRDEELEATFGPMHRPHIEAGTLLDAPSSDNGPLPELPLERLYGFKRGLGQAIEAFQAAGVRPVVMTISLLGNDLDHPINGLLRAYSHAQREAAQEREAQLVDVERAFRDIYDRASTYKQHLRLTGPDGKLNVQGQTLIARTFLAAFGLLPPSGSRP